MSPPSPTALTGIMVALVTPFTADKKRIDFEALDEHIQRLIDAGVHGLVPGGSTGEFTVLSVEERKQLVEAVVKYASGRVPVVAGVGDLSTERAIELAVHAAQTGAASVMVVPQFYDALSLEQLTEFMGDVHKASGLPIMYYNIPSAGGLTLTPEQIAGLSKVGVKYMKDTSGNAPDLTEFLFHRHNEITTFNGWDTLTFYGLAAGAKGSVWGTTNFLPELSVQLWNTIAVEGDLEKGRELWTKISPICRLLEEGNYAGAVKTGMELRGWSTGGLRKPFDLLKGEQRQRLNKLLKDAGVDTVE
ncbi:Putative aldolase-type TIM barrel, schiff base-forming aldolase [Septoria linicola]|uniref:Aldolase-type TIM barrel, schiff base-forming aldolase n=1 Tax=Septoria linicola TaxID=215465 RepID=A0A9Q9B091_9PEZI|nr:putative aldolase-type TIM barrel, schiff base-forming aldolase [Septoria linicola]USW55243.1 Putative aldolase-type TIM barrel, schiff base-forming aldolase [Septoria linicola]